MVNVRYGVVVRYRVEYGRRGGEVHVRWWM